MPTDDNWNGLRALIDSASGHERGSAVSGASGLLEARLRQLGFMRTEGVTFSDAPRQLGPAVALLVDAIPLSPEVERRIKFARELRNEVSHGARVLSREEAGMAFSALEEFHDTVLAWAKGAGPMRVRDLEKRARLRQRRGRWRFPWRSSSRRDVEPGSERAPVSDPFTLEDAQEAVRSVLSFWDLVGPAREMVTRHAAKAAKKLYDSRERLGRAANTLIFLFFALTSTPFLITALWSSWIAEAAARIPALIAVVGVWLFGSVVVAAMTILSQIAGGAVLLPRRIFLAGLSAAGRVSAAREFARFSRTPSSLEETLTRLIDTLPKYLDASVKVPCSLWAAWVLCFPYVGLAPFGVAFVGLITMLMIGSVSRASSWEQSSSKVKGLVAGATGLGLGLGATTLAFPVFLERLRALGTVFGTYLSARVGEMSMVFDFSQSSPWKVDPFAQYARSLALASVAFPCLVGAFTLGRFFSTSPESWFPRTLGRAFVLLSAGWILLAVGMLYGTGASPSALAQASQAIVASAKDPGSVAVASQNVKVGINAGGPGSSVDPGIPTQIGDWRSELRASTCSEPCSTGLACRSNPSACPSGLTCIPGPANEKLDPAETWLLHLSGVYLADDISDPCQTGRDFWVCRAGSDQCFSQRDACKNARVAAVSSMGIQISGMELEAGVVLEVREGGRSGTVLGTTRPLRRPSASRRTGLCIGFHVEGEGIHRLDYFLLPP